MIKRTIKIGNYKKTAICKCDKCGIEFKRAYLHAKRAMKQFCGYNCQYSFYKTKEAKKLYIAKSTAKLGKKNPMFGKKLNPIHKRKLAKANTKRIQNKKNLRMAADRLWSRIILVKGCCEICGKVEHLNPHHIIGRKNMTLRYDFLNGICLCVGCHIFKVKSAHQDPIWFIDWLKNKYPDRIDYLGSQRNKITKRTWQDYQELIDNLRKKDIFYER